MPERMQQENGGDRNQQQPQQQQQQHNQQQQQWLQMQQQQHQQWMAMQYQAAAMQHQMLYAQQQYMAYHQQPESHLQSQQQQQQQQPDPLCGDDNKTVWVGDLHHWMDENYLYSCFAHTGEVISAKIIRNKQTGQPEGYGFVEFFSRAGAEKVLQCYNGILMPNTEQPFRLNWASFNSNDRRLDGVPDYSIFVGDLAPDVTDKILQETFASVYSSVKGAKVVMDPNTGRSKGYGFVRFSDENEKSRSITEMNGMYCLNRPMRCSVATPKKSPGYQQQYSSQALILTGGYAANGFALQNTEPEYDPANTTIFVGGLHSEVSEEELREPFSEFGEVVSVKIPVGKGCGFVQFSERTSATEAIERLNGVVIGNQAVRLSWGRNAANRQLSREAKGDYYYGGGQGYEDNGPSLPHDSHQDQTAYATTQVS